VHVSMRRYPLYGGATGGFDTPALGVTVGQPGEGGRGREIRKEWDTLNVSAAARCWES
jgi:hypothetical protein